MPRRNRSGAHYRHKRHEARKQAEATTDAVEVTTDELARGLVEIGAHFPLTGDPAAVSATLRRWTDEVGPYRLAVVCMAATQAVFADCLTPTTREDWPDGGALSLTAPEEGNPTDD